MVIDLRPIAQEPGPITTDPILGLYKSNEQGVVPQSDLSSIIIVSGCYNDLKGFFYD